MSSAVTVLEDRECRRKRGREEDGKGKGKGNGKGKWRNGETCRRMRYIEMTRLGGWHALHDEYTAGTRLLRNIPFSSPYTHYYRPRGTTHATPSADDAPKKHPKTAIHIHPNCCYPPAHFQTKLAPCLRVGECSAIGPVQVASLLLKGRGGVCGAGIPWEDGGEFPRYKIYGGSRYPEQIPVALDSIFTDIVTISTTEDANPWGRMTYSVRYRTGLTVPSGGARGTAPIPHRLTSIRYGRRRRNRGGRVDRFV